MKMNIPAMLEYQASDQIIYKAEQAFAGSVENRRYAAVQAKIAELRQAVIKMDKDASETDIRLAQARLHRAMIRKSVASRK